MKIDGLSSNVNYSNFEQAEMDNKIDLGQGEAKFIELENDSRTREEKYSKEELIELIERANDDFVVYDRRFEFSIHEKTKKITVKVFDTVTDEIIREVPPEKILDLVAGIWEIAGIIVDKKI